MQVQVQVNVVVPSRPQERKNARAVSQPPAYTTNQEELFLQPQKGKVKKPALKNSRPDVSNKNTFLLSCWPRRQQIGK